MATPSARDMLMQVQRYADGGTASAGSSVGLARALANGTSQEQYYQNIREYVAKNPNPLAALNAASENGVSTADINSALGTKAASDYFTIDYNTETAPSANVATGFTSALAQRYNAPGGPGQSTLDRRIKEISQQYAANTPENAQILRDMFIKEGASIADVQRAGVDPSVLLGTVARSTTVPEPKLPVIPTYTPPVVTPETQTQFPQPKPYTATPVYQPLPEPPPIYATGKPALDVGFRDSAPRTYDPVYGYTYSPAAKLLSATGAGMSWTPPSVTSRPRELLKVPLPTAANPQYSASQQFARDRAAAQLAALPVGGGGRFSGTPAPEAPPVDPNAPVDPYAVKPEEFRFYAPKVAAKGGEIKKSEGSAQEELARFVKGGIIDKAIQKGAEALGFDNERQIAISKEAADLTNQMVDAGLIEDQYRVQLSIPEDVTKRTRLNTGIKGDEEVFNAVNHALFAYDAGQSTLGKVGAQAKELYQGLVKKMGGGDPRSEYLDYFNNKFGFNLAEQGLSREEAKRAIISNVGNLDEQGTRGRLFRGEEIKGGTDLLTNVQDAKYPWEKPLGYDKGGPVSQPMTNAELLAQMDRIGATPNAKTPDPAPTREQTESRNMLRRINDTFGRNVTAPVLGSIVDMSVGIGDIGQVATKYLANRAGIETAPVTPVASNIKSKLGLEYDPYHPAAIATQLALPALSRARAMTSAASPAVRAVAAPPGSAKELLERVGGEAAREGQIYVGSELGAQTAREIAPDNAMAEMVGAMIGGTAVNTAQNLDPRTVNNITQAQMASSMIPIAGGAVKAARAVGKASKAAKVAEEIPETARQMLDQAAPARAVQTDTPEFKNWFGNSQLLDESGKPKVFYHTTAKDFDKFKPGGFDPELSGPAMWFGDDPAALPAAHNVRKDTEGANVMPVYLRMQRPLVMDDQASKEWARSAFADDWREFPLLVTDKIVKDIKDEGYDGIIFRHGDGNTEYITFDPTQIKSAIGNEGTFDPANPVITKAQGGYITKKTKGAKP